MSLFAVADLHLSLGVEKPMDIFSGWEGYLEKLKYNWNSNVTKYDTVVVAGDISWGMDLKEALKDFEFLNALPGRKILIRGNHDYFFSTKGKMDRFFFENGFSSLNFLFNNSYEYDNISICGTRGWANIPGEEGSLQNNKKILQREAGRLQLSLNDAKKKPIVFLHYPPIFCNDKSQEILDVLYKNNIKNVYYGHLHGKSCKYAIKGEVDGINYGFISSDYLNFNLLKIL